METESSLDSMETDSSLDPDDLAEMDVLVRSPRKDLRFKYLRSADPTLFEEVKWLSRGDFIQGWHRLRFPEDAGDSQSSAEELLEHIQQSEEPYFTYADCQCDLIEVRLACRGAEAFQLHGKFC